MIVHLAKIYNDVTVVTVTVVTVVMLVHLAKTPLSPAPRTSAVRGPAVLRLETREG